MRSETVANVSLAIIARASGQRRIIRVGPISIGVVLEHSDTGGAFELLEFHAAPGSPGPRPHFHRTCSETFLVQEGVLRLVVGSETVDAAAGMVVSVPAGVPHTFSYPGPEAVRFLVLTAPSIRLAAYFDEVASLAAKGWPPAPGAMDAITARYDMPGHAG